MSFNFQFQPDLIDPSVVLTDGVQIYGNVVIGAESSVWFNSVIRGDTEQITIGERTNVQDLCLIHADAGKPCRIGNDCTLGHSAIVHGATVEDQCMIGIRATVLNNAVIGRGSLIAAGAVVPEGAIVAPHSVVMGIPGKTVRQCSEHDLERIQYASKHYVAAAKAFRESRSNGSQEN